jgi:hypothetical protein
VGDWNVVTSGWSGGLKGSSDGVSGERWIEFGGLIANDS